MQKKHGVCIKLKLKAITIVVKCSNYKKWRSIKSINQGYIVLSIRDLECCLLYTENRLGLFLGVRVRTCEERVFCCIIYLTSKTHRLLYSEVFLCASRMCNRRPPALRDNRLSLNAFRRRLKANYVFNQWWWTTPGIVLAFLWLQGCICHVYLLTYLLTYLLGVLTYKWSGLGHELRWEAYSLRKPLSRWLWRSLPLPQN